ncbi:hypothetical protein BT96DRAFT_950581 [Gymnopus androsaceus JB14]|uniref:CCHC-type domain-containing protein n=1 Tax=Gymnopus androsaceus JB14 TaxID=1447944 RepID=A0A6A4GG24_9AGAR|nr:hypothetical protein BT96DRAFT_950581 [Gymnopus androsaceus JB14]
MTLKEFACFMCGDKSHMMGNCPKFLEFLTQGWIVPDPNGGKMMFLKDGQKLPRGDISTKKKSNKLWADNDEDSTNEPSTPSSPTPSQSQAQASSHTGLSVINLLSDNEASDGENPKATKEEQRKQISEQIAKQTAPIYAFYHPNPKVEFDKDIAKLDGNGCCLNNDDAFTPSVVPLLSAQLRYFIALQTTHSTRNPMTTGNHLLNIPTFPEASQLSGQDTWRAFKDRVELNVQVKGLMGYLDGSIPKPTSATYLYAAQTASSIDSQFPSPGEWVQRDRIVASIIYLNCTDPIGIGIERDTVANKTWKYLVKKYESRDEQRIHIADTILREHKFNPETSTMEDHEKKMKNLLKTLHNLGGTCNDYQFRMIVVASMPDTWKDYVLNVPGMLSSEAFTYLHRLYLDKVVRTRDVDDDPVKKQVAALFAQHLAVHAATIAASAKRDNSNRPICTNPPCPTKVGHTIERCWAKGGGAEGKAPKSWRDKYSGTQASPNTTASPIDVYVGSTSSPKQPDSEWLMPF